VILATAGHIDHGKTALVRALTGVDADRLPEEKRRGLTIDLGFAYTTLPDGTELGFVDVPGHERFLPNMLAGVLSIDRVLLIVAADDGPRPQTLEHLDILELIGIAGITAVITKIDRVAAERRAAVEGEVAALLAASRFGGSPVFALSSRTGEGVAALAAHLGEMAVLAASARAARPPSGLFRMPIDRAFSLPGIGPVVTGTVVAGSVAPGDRLSVTPSGIAVRVRGVHAQNRPALRAAAGERCAVNIVGSFPEGSQPGRGDWLVAPERHAPVDRIDIRLGASRTLDKGLRDGLPVHVHLGTADVVGRLALLGGRALDSGEAGLAQLHLESSIGALHGDRVVLRDHAARQTLGGGRVVDPFPPYRGRSRPGRLALLDAMAEPSPAAALARMLQTGAAVPLARFALARNLTAPELAAIVEEAACDCFGHGETAVAIAPARLAALGERLTETLVEWHRRHPDTAGPARPQLLRQLRTEAPETALEAALAGLLAAGKVVREGALLRLSEHRPRVSREDERLWEGVRPLLEAGGLRPPRVRELAPELGLELEPLIKFLKRMERFGRVVQVADNRFFLPETLARHAEIARDLAQDSPEGRFSAVAFKDRTGVGRNVSIEILEHLDRVGLTRRVGDLRILRNASASSASR